MDSTPLEFLCLDCGTKGTESEFGAFIRCPRCHSADVLNYRLWKKHGAITPPPRNTRVSLADVPAALQPPPRQDSVSS